MQLDTALDEKEEQYVIRSMFAAFHTPHIQNGNNCPLPYDVLSPYKPSKQLKCCRFRATLEIIFSVSCVFGRQYTVGLSEFIVEKAACYSCRLS